jgi:hypothetical protein
MAILARPARTHTAMEAATAGPWLGYRLTSAFNLMHSA